MFSWTYPNIDPIAVSLGPIVIRWYALAYLAGFLFGWRYCMKLALQSPSPLTPKLYDDFLFWAVLGTVLGGRLGYILFYQSDYYFNNPFEMLKIWHGGMSFHGGMMGVIIAAWMFTRHYKVPFFAFTDLLACVAPLGLGFGRLANFVNGELYGRMTTMPWGMVFPRGGDVLRHPSQLYEALMEGVVLFVIMFFLSRRASYRGRVGLLSGTFLSLYGLFRFAIEFFREPDIQLGFLYGGATMGQLLCLPMILFGVYVILWSERRLKRRSVV